MKYVKATKEMKLERVVINLIRKSLKCVLGENPQRIRGNG